MTPYKLTPNNSLVGRKVLTFKKGYPDRVAVIVDDTTYVNRWIVEDIKHDLLHLIHTPDEHNPDVQCKLMDDNEVIIAEQSEELKSAIAISHRSRAADEPRLPGGTKISHVLKIGDRKYTHDDFNRDITEQLCLEEAAKKYVWESQTKYIGYTGDIKTFKAGAEWQKEQNKPSIPTDYEILKKSLEHSDNLYNSNDKCKDNILSENQLWENSLRDYEAGYKQALSDLGIIK